MKPPGALETVVLALLTLVVILLALAFQRAPVQPASLPEPRSSFDTAWADAMMVVEFRKADMLRVSSNEFIGAPQPVKTERRHPDAPVGDVSSVIVPPAPNTLGVRSRRHVAKTRKDVCARHGLRKVKTGDRWRCRK